ncbi:MAG: hypothetical protein LBB72_07690 [Spirochaetaceae bacterium]|nr:hypothetical protein [Spirochaetaceae bacterium]
MANKNSGAIPPLQKAIRKESLDGWLFYDFSRRITGPERDKQDRQFTLLKAKKDHERT